MTINWYNSSPLCWLHFAVVLHCLVLSTHNMCTIKKFAFMKQHMLLSPVLKNQWIPDKKNTLINHYTEYWDCQKLNQLQYTPDRAWNFIDFLIVQFVQSAKNSLAWNKFPWVNNSPVKCLKQIGITFHFTLRKR